MTTLTASVLKPLIETLARGTFFTVINVKINGETRRYNCRLGVKTYLKGGDLPFSAEEKNLITVFDVFKSEYRNINVATIKELQVRGIKLITDSKPTPHLLTLLN